MTEDIFVPHDPSTTATRLGKFIDEHLEKKGMTEEQTLPTHIEKEIFGFNDRGIVSYYEPMFKHELDRASCNNCGEEIKGEEAKTWKFGHVGCPKPNGEYLRTDITPEKLRKVISDLLLLERQKCLAEVREKVPTLKVMYQMEDGKEKPVWVNKEELDDLLKSLEGETV